MENKENTDAFSGGLHNFGSEIVGTFDNINIREPVSVKTYEPVARHPLTDVNNINNEECGDTAVAHMRKSLMVRSHIPVPKMTVNMGHGAFKPVQTKNTYSGVRKAKECKKMTAKNTGHGVFKPVQTKNKYSNVHKAKESKPTRQKSLKKMPIICRKQTNSESISKNKTDRSTQVHVDLTDKPVTIDSTDEIEILRKENHDLQEQLIVLKLHECRIQNLQQHLDNRDEEVKTITVQHEKFKDDMAYKTITIDNLQHTLDCRDKELETLRIEQNRLKSNIIERSQALNTMQQEKQNYQEMVRQYHVLQDQVQNIQSGATETEEFARLECVALKEELKDSTNQLHSTTHELDSTRVQVEQLKMEINKLQSEVDQTKKCLQEVNEELDSTKLQAHSMLLQQAQEIAASQSAAAKLSSQVNQIYDTMKSKSATWSRYDGLAACDNKENNDASESSHFNTKENSDLETLLSEQICTIGSTVGQIGETILQLEDNIDNYCQHLRLQSKEFAKQISVLENQQKLLKKREEQQAVELIEKKRDLKYVRELLQNKTDALANNATLSGQLKDIQLQLNKQTWQLREKEAECMALHQSLDLAVDRAACEAPHVAAPDLPQNSQLIRENQILQCELGRLKVKSLERNASTDKQIAKLVKHNKVLRDNQSKADNELMRIDNLLEQILCLLRNHKEIVLGWPKAESVLKDLL